MISTMGVLYSLGKEVDETSSDLKGIIAKNIPLPSAVAYILFVMIYNPCFAATIVFSKESGKIKYTFFLFLFTCCRRKNKMSQKKNKMSYFCDKLSFFQP